MVFYAIPYYGLIAVVLFLTLITAETEASTSLFEAEISRIDSYIETQLRKANTWSTQVSAPEGSSPGGGCSCNRIRLSLGRLHFENIDEPGGKAVFRGDLFWTVDDYQGLCRPCQASIGMRHAGIEIETIAFFKGHGCIAAVEFQSPFK